MQFSPEYNHLTNFSFTRSVRKWYRENGSYERIRVITSPGVINFLLSEANDYDRDLILLNIEFFENHCKPHKVYKYYEKSGGELIFPNLMNDMAPECLRQSHGLPLYIKKMSFKSFEKYKEITRPFKWV